jgi:glycosyltransferase involved in cell wall biosynthesis
MFGMAHAVIVHSDAAAREASDYFALSKRARGKIRVVPHAGYFGTYPETVSRGEARASFGLSKSHFCYGSIGRLQPYKGIEELIEAFRQMPGCHLRLLAAGQVHSMPLRRWLEEQCVADPRIILLPERIPEDRLQACFAAADVVAYPFRDQLTSGSVLTAASFGRALVLPEAPGLAAGLPPGGRILFKSGNRVSLLDALEKVSTCDTEAMGAENRRATESPEMSWETMGRRTIEVYRAVLA